MMQERLLGIFGHPVAHSLSPLMHNRAAELLGLPFRYAAFDVAPASLKSAVGAIRTLGLAGVNVTVPHKEEIIPFLDTLDREAKTIGAVNTVTIRNGKLAGSNTDGFGFLRALKMEGQNPRGKKAVVIGAGGSSRAIVVALLRSGARSVTVVNRTSANGRLLARHLSRFGKVSNEAVGSAACLNAINEADIVVQTTPVGMKRSDPLPVADPPFRKGQLVYDIIYSPRETALLKLAKKRGARTMNGLSMLVYQGSESFRMWTGKRFPETEILAYLKKRLEGK